MMKRKFLLFFICLLSVFKSLLFSQGGWKEAENANSYQYLYIGVGNFYNPRRTVYIRLGQEQFIFHTYDQYTPTMIFLRAEIRYDGENWQVICKNGRYVATPPVTPPWTQTGQYEMDLKIWDEAGNIKVHTFPVIVIPPANKRYVDDNGNSMLLWSSEENLLDFPFILVAGFDPDIFNSSDHEFYYFVGKELIDKIHSVGGDVLIYDYADGAIDIAENAQYVKNAVNYINSIKIGNTRIILGGVSMGGVVCRYALAEAEAQGNPLNVSHFVSLDSP